jgi:O-antigen ligase
VIALFAAFVLTHWPGWRAWKTVVFPAGVVVFGLAAVVLSGTRGALLGLLVGGLVLLWYSNRRFILTLLLLGALILVAVLPATREQLSSVLGGEDVSTDVRSVLWVGTARLLHANPIVGAGLAGFPLLYEDFKLAKHTELLLYPHTILFNIWVELGLAGVFVFLLIVIVFYLVAADGLRLETARPMSVGLIAAMTTLLGHGLVDVPYFKNDLSVLFWLLAAFAVVNKSLVPSVQPPPGRTS